MRARPEHDIQRIVIPDAKFRGTLHHVKRSQQKSDGVMMLYQQISLPKTVNATGLGFSTSPRPGK